MYLRNAIRLSIVWLLASATAMPTVYAIQKTGERLVNPAPSARRPPRVMLVVVAGYGLPLSRNGITQFWHGGPSASATVLVSANRMVSFGLGVDAALLNFRSSAFEAAYPGIAVQSRNIGYLSLYLAWRYTPFYRYRVAPYLGADVGVSRFTGASDWEIINGVRKTYYFIPGIARLTFAFLGGTDITIARSVVMTVQAKLTYVHNDPNAGLGLLTTGGFRFIL